MGLPQPLFVAFGRATEQPQRAPTVINGNPRVGLPGTSPDADRRFGEIRQQLPSRHQIWSPTERQSTGLASTKRSRR